MEPNIWGPGAWLFLHSITLQYPDNPTEIDKENYKNFFESLQEVLPCPSCSEHYKNNLNKFPIRVESKDELIEWLIDIHNEVNVVNNKEVLTYDQVKNNYKKIYNNTSNFNRAAIIIIISLIIILYYYRYKKK